MDSTVTAERLHDDRETANMLRVSAVTLWRARRRGAIGYYKIGGRVRYSDAHIREFLEAAEHEREGGNHELRAR